MLAGPPYHSSTFIRLLLHVFTNFLALVTGEEQGNLIQVQECELTFERSWQPQNPAEDEHVPSEAVDENRYNSQISWLSGC